MGHQPHISLTLLLLGLSPTVPLNPSLGRLEALSESPKLLFFLGEANWRSKSKRSFRRLKDTAVRSRASERKRENEARGPQKEPGAVALGKQRWLGCAGGCPGGSTCPRAARGRAAVS